MSAPDFEKIYTEYFSDVYKYVLSLCRNEATAEEITQETFFKAMRHIDKFNGTCKLYVWLCQIAKNTYYSYQKKNERTTSVDEAELQNMIAPDAFVEELIGAQEEAKQIRKILHELPDPYKEVFMWRVFGELSFKAIGELYNKTDNWACVTYHRARKMMQHRFGGNQS